MHDLFLNSSIFWREKKEKSEQSNDHSNRNSRYFFFWIEGKSKPQFNTILAKSKYTFHTVLLTMELEIQVEEKRKIFYLSWILILRLRTIFFGSCTVKSHSRVIKMIVGLWPENEILPSVDFPNLSRDQCSDIVCFKRRYDVVHYRL